jgi:DNA-binding beta-propeller fold protein YncE
VRTVMIRVPGMPFGVVAPPSGGFALVALGPSVGVVRYTGTGPVRLVRRQSLPTGIGLGEALAGHGRYLLVADAVGGADVLSVSKTERGEPGAVLGTLRGGRNLYGAIEVATSKNSRFAFVSIESNASVAVFDLRDALKRGFGPADFVGTIPVGIAPVGMAVSPDGRWLYVTSEVEVVGGAPKSLANTPGTLSVVSIRRAESAPARSVVATLEAGCQPVRVITSASGRFVWVTARASNAVLCFSAARLTSDPRHALVAAVRVGEAPVGLALSNGGSRIVVADSNRFGAPGATATLAVISVPRALAGRPSLLGYLRAGQFPREMAVLPGGKTLLVANYGSRQIESVDLAGLP